MSTSIHCMYVEFDYTYIDINALAPIRPQLLVSHGSRVETKISFRLGFVLYAITGHAIVGFFISFCRTKYSSFIIFPMSTLRRL